MFRPLFTGIILLLLIVVVPGTSRAANFDDSAASSSPFMLGSSIVAAKIQPSVLQQLQDGEQPRALIVFAEQADVSAAANLPNKQAKGRFVFDTLRATANRTQVAVRALLEQRGIRYRSYYVVNLIAVSALDAALVAEIAARAEVGRIAANPDVRMPDPFPGALEPEAANAVEWGVQKIKADKMWQEGFRGQDIVVANQDTGVQWQHPALLKQYRGYDKTTGKAKHNYNWWDAIHSTLSGGSNPCGLSVKKPCDDGSHGTHTMGTIVGKAAGNKIGVAPKAKWISCRNMDRNVGSPSTYMECYEFFLAPWNSKGLNANPDRAPHIVSNSWYCPPDEGCEQDTFLIANNNLRAAGIFLAVAAGNSGPGCSTISYAPDHYDSSTSVGATDSADQLVSFSSRGPVTADASNRLKPDLAAPGSNVRSSIPNNAYGSMSGTSMAAPHLAGAVALLWDAVPSLIGDVSATEQALFSGANPNVTISGNPSQTCGGTDHEDIPNNLFGYGRLDVWKAYQLTLP